ncbi:MAG: methyltransferase domain-containing protein [Acidobacteriota bacterium]
MLASIPQVVNQFYEDNPFPGYRMEKYRTRRDLARLASWYARLLDAHIPFDASVADVGCGTGQLSCFLALKGRPVTGFDFTRASLTRATELAERLGLSSARFVWADVLALDVPDASFDYVFCNGVLHHTPDPRRGFSHVARICKPGGYVAVGLYNTYGRTTLRARRFVVNALSRTFRKVEEREIDGLFDGAERSKKEIYFADQFRHPYESVHSVGQALRWFREEGISYVNSFPSIEIFRKPAPFEDPFTRPDAGAWRRSAPSILGKQLTWVLRLGPAGGYFVIVGRKHL